MKPATKSTPAARRAPPRPLAELSEQRPMMRELQRRAEAQLRQQRKNQPSMVADMKPAADSHRLFHELQVHQVELEMQNVELKESRDRAELLREKFTDLYDFAPVGYLSLDEHGQILEVNLSGAALLRVERAQLVNRRLPGFVTPASRGIFLAFLKRIFARPGKQECEAILLRRDGTSFWARFHGVSAISLGSSRKMCRVSVSDINLTKLAEEALGASEQRYRLLFQMVPVAVYSCDVSGVIQNFNRRAGELWGREPASGDTDERFCGSFKLFRPNGRFMPHHQCPMAEVLSGKLPAVQDGEVIIERPDGSQITVLVNICALKNNRGEVTGAINCFYDVTERKRAEATQRRVEVLAASNRKLEQEIVRRRAGEEALRKSEEHQRRLLAQSQQMQEKLRQLSRQVLRAQEDERMRISRELHDVIAQTLTGINIRLAALNQGAGFNARGFDRHLAHTQRLVEKSVNIVHQFARELRPPVLDDLGLIPALHSFMKNFTTQTGVRAHLSAFAGVEQLDTARRTVLFRVAQEALINVARHAKASLVKVSIQKLPDNICMKINDDGKSFMADRALRASTGKRLGLLGMRERLEMVGGSFGVESAPGKGTTIIAQIPRHGSRGGGGGADGVR